MSTVRQAADPGNAGQATPVTGRIRMTSAGFGFVRRLAGDVYLAAEDLDRALHGDEVEVETRAASRGIRGRVLRIIHRPSRRLCGVVGPDGLFVADDERFHRPLRVEGHLPKPEDSDVVCGAESLPDVGSGAEARVLRCFGRRGRPGAEVQAILWRERLDEEFPSWVMAEAIARSEMGVLGQGSSREDLRHLDFVTIDPSNAEDHDDALHVETVEEGGVRLRVAIADVASFVPSGSALDMEARRRGATLYLPGRVVPMLPRALSAGAASLLPDQDRPAVVVDLTIGPDGAVRDRRFVHALVRSRAKMTYEQVAGILGTASEGTGTERHIHLLDRMAQLLRQVRCGRGAMVVTTPPIRVDVDPENGMPTAITRERLDPARIRAAQLVEESMLAANEAVAAILEEKGADAPFRMHPRPADARIRSVLERARDHGAEIDPGESLDVDGLRKALAKLDDAALRDELGAILLEIMPGALYVGDAQPHYALAAERYIHFTSPIRRYPDLLVHRAVHAVLEGRTPVDSPDFEQLNACQERARRIHREVGSLYGAILMRGREGQELAGTVLRTTKRWIYVGIDDPAVCVRCPTPRRASGLQRVRIRISKVDLASRTIDGTYEGEEKIP